MKYFTHEIFAIYGTCNWLSDYVSGQELALKANVIG